MARRQQRSCSKDTVLLPPARRDALQYTIDLLDTAFADFTRLCFILPLIMTTSNNHNNSRFANCKLPTVSRSCLFPTRHFEHHSNAPSMAAPTSPSSSLVGLWGNVANYDLDAHDTTTTSLPRMIPTIPLRATRFRPIHLLQVVVGSPCMETSCAMIHNPIAIVIRHGTFLNQAWYDSVGSIDDIWRLLSMIYKHEM